MQYSKADLLILIEDVIKESIDYNNLDYSIGILEGVSLVIVHVLKEYKLANSLYHHIDYLKQLRKHK